MTGTLGRPNDFEDSTLGVEDAAKVMRLGLEAMKELIDKGTVPAVRLNQKHTVLLREDLISFLREEGRRQAAARRCAAGARQAAGSAQRHLTEKKIRCPRTSPPDLAVYELKD